MALWHPARRTPGEGLRAGELQGGSAGQQHWHHLEPVREAGSQAPPGPTGSETGRAQPSCFHAPSRKSGSAILFRTTRLESSVGVGSGLG